MIKPTPSTALQHIPGSDGWPLFGETFEYLRDPYNWWVERHRRHGRVFRSYMFFDAGIIVAGSDFAERFLLDKEQVYSSELGWWPLLGDFFRHGLMLRDFDVHRLHRRIMQIAFKREALDGYVAIMQPMLERAVESIGPRVYPWVKQATLDVASAIFLGFDRPADTQRANDMFVAILTAAGAAFRWAIPGTTYWRGQRSSEALRTWLRGLIPERRANPGRDMMSILCAATSEQGERLDDEAIVDHLVFLLMAAHDTTTSALTTLIMELGRRPEWQERLRQEPALIYDAFREVLRLYPPVRSIPRRTLREVEIEGKRVPANTQVWLNIEATHRDPAIWSEPDLFDPTRFSDARAEHKKHRFAWVPFGAGAHTCLGLQFSEMQVKILMQAMLKRYRWTIEEAPLQYVPFIKPRNDLPIRVEALQ